MLAAAPHTHTSLLAQMADLYAGTGDIERAISLYDAGLARYPGDPTLGNNLAYVLAQAGKDLDRAESLVRRALTDPTLNDTNRGIYLDTLAWVHRKQGKNKEALSEQLLAIRLTQSANLADTLVFYVHLADIHDALKDEPRAREARLRARLHDPNKAPIPMTNEP